MEDNKEIPFQEQVILDADSLFDKQEYGKCVSFIESKLSSIRNASEINRNTSGRVYQFYDEYNYFFYSKLTKMSFVVDFDYEYRLFLIMVDCFDKMKKYNKELNAIQEGLKLVPYDSQLIDFKMQVLKKTNDMKGLKELLDDYLKYTWRATEMFKVCFNYAYYYIEMKKYEVATNYLIVAGYYDISEKATELIKGELDYIESITGEKADIDNMSQAFEYLEDEGYPYKITDEANEVLMQMYTNYLNDSLEVPDEEKAFLRNNLLIMNLGVEWLPRLIECLVYNDARYYERDGYAFQINRRWKDTDSYFDDMLPNVGATFVKAFVKEGKVNSKILIYAFSRYATISSEKERAKIMNSFSENSQEQEMDSEEKTEPQTISGAVSMSKTEDENEEKVSQITEIVEKTKNDKVEESQVITFDKALEILKQNAKTVLEETKYTSENNIEVTKVRSSDSADNTVVEYMFKFAKDSFGAIKMIECDDEVVNNSTAKEIENIINRWEYID